MHAACRFFLAAISKEFLQFSGNYIFFGLFGSEHRKPTKLIYIKRMHVCHGIRVWIDWWDIICNRHIHVIINGHAPSVARLCLFCIFQWIERDCSNDCAISFIHTLSQLWNINQSIMHIYCKYCEYPSEHSLPFPESNLIRLLVEIAPAPAHTLIYHLQFHLKILKILGERCSFAAHRKSPRFI